MNRRLTGLSADATLSGLALPWFPLPAEGDGPNGGSGTGGGNADDGADDPDDVDDDAQDGDGGDPKPDPAEEKIQKARQEAAERRRELRPWKALARDFGLTPEQVRERLEGKAPAGKPDEAPVDADAIRREADRTATERANQRIVRAEVRAVAAELFEDPADAPLFVDLSKFDVDDDGSVDEDEIRDELKALLARKPHLAKRTAPGEPQPRTPRPDPSQGPRGGTSKTSLREAFERRQAELAAKASRAIKQ